MTNKDTRRPSSLGTLLSLVPCVADADSELRAIGVECDGRHRGVVLGVLAQTLLELVVPDGYRAVRAGRGKGIVPAATSALSICANERVYSHWVECERVDRPDVIDVVDSLAVALERVLLLLHFGAGVEVFDGDTSFHGCRGVT